VIEDTAPPPHKPSLWRRCSDAVAANPAAAAIALYAIVALAASVAAYFLIFTVFAPYDDEGTLLVTLKAFVHGDALYRDIWSVYGPLYYELFGGLFSLTGQEVTTDASRTIVIVIWVATSLMFGLAAQRLSGRLALGITGMIAAFSALTVLANEPMHPQGLCVLLLGAFALLAASGPTRRVGWSGAGCGVLLAALILTKVNLGLYAVAAVAVAAVVTVEPLHRRSWLRWLVIAAFLALPLFVLKADFRLSWVRELFLLEVLAAAAVLVASRPLWPGRGENDGGTLRWVLFAAAGFGLAFAAIIVVVVLTGPTPTDVYNGVVRDATRIRDVLIGAFPLPPGAALDWAIGAVAAAALASWLRLAGGRGRPSIWPGLLRAAAGLTILLVVAHVVPLGLNPSSASPVLVPMLLAWVVAIPPAGAAEPPYKRFLRVLLPLLAVAEVLQGYPVPGSQLGIAAVTFVPVGALCLGDALTDLRAWSADRGAPAARNLAATTAVLSVALPAMFALQVIVLPGTTNAILYNDEPELALPGAQLMHVPASTAETYSELVDLLHRHRCSTFVGYPNFNSLYLWSGLEAPAPQIPNAWMYATTRSQQQRVVNELRASPRPCAIKNEELVGPYLKGLPPPDTPLVNYVLDDFRPAARVGGFEFLLPKPPAR
jgi:hypothetical protein